MWCPNCGHEMGKASKCLRCGYVNKGIIPIDPEKIEREREDEPVRKEVNPDDVHVSRAGGGSIFGDIFGGGFFGGIGDIFGSLFGGFGLFGEDEDVGYEYDPKYYDDFGNEIDLPDEFERESVEIRDAEVLEEPPKAASHGTSSSHGKSSPHAAPPQDRHRAKEGNLRRKRRPGRH